MEFEKLRNSLEKSEKNLRENIFLEKGVTKIEEALLKISKSERVSKAFPLINEKAMELKTAKNVDERELAFIELYIALHQAGVGYTEKEEKLLNGRRGLKGLPGGILPVILCSHLMKKDYVFADLGAGNGLQGLLLQYLFPHKQTRQIEFSASHLETGRLYMDALELDKESLSFEQGDILDSKLGDIDLIYMYRPARPMEEGILFYEKLSEKLALKKEPFILVSVADCFEKYIKTDFKKLFESEFLKIMMFNF